MASRAIDLLITYRVVKLLVTRWENQEAFKRGIIDNKGKVLRPNKTLKDTKDKKAYTYLHRFVFNMKRLFAKVGLGSRFGSFAGGLAMVLREDKRLLNDGLNYFYKEGLVFERTTSLGPGADMGERLDKLGPKAKKKK